MILMFGSWRWGPAWQFWSWMDFSMHLPTAPPTVQGCLDSLHFTSSSFIDKFRLVPLEETSRRADGRKASWRLGLIPGTILLLLCYSSQINLEKKCIDWSKAKIDATNLKRKYANSHAKNVNIGKSFIKSLNTINILQEACGPRCRQSRPRHEPNMTTACFHK